ncbi:MAG TPA: apolipoprotein N-acyltransferase [Bacteroidia bacterium]|nr:apolipoprotein N-acyltransferase [Bacteroidia bacterium]
MKITRPANLFLAFLSGIFLSIAWPQNGFAPLLFIAWIPLLIVEDYFYVNRNEVKAKKLFGLSYLSFLVWNILTTWWVWNATDVGSIAAFACNSLFMALVFTMFHFTRCKAGNVTGYISLPVYWIAFEYIHLQWELSWPWLTLGNGFASSYKWIQWYEYTGVLGGSLWILMVNILLFKIIFLQKPQTSPSSGGIKPQTIITALIIVLPVIYSLIRYNKYKETSHPVNISIVQPNIDPYNEKFSGMNARDQLLKLLRLASTVTDSLTDYLAAPETALPNGIWEEDLQNHPDIKLLRSFMKAFPNLTVVIGAATNRMYEEGKPHSETARKFTDSPAYYDSYNTALQLDNFTGSIQAYHKSKLVPGVEKMPYPKIFGFLEKLSINLGGMSGSLGAEKEPFDFISNDSIKIAPIICYESVYGDYIAKYVRKGAHFLFIITNDGWWGNTPGHRQHLEYGRLRAIEMRRSIARSANTGISCFINQRGDISHATKYWEDDAIKETLNANNEITFYAKHGDDFFKKFCWASLLLLTYTVYKKFRK